MQLFRFYIRYFVIGIILAALVFGSLSLKATQTEQPPRLEQCEPRYCDETPKRQQKPCPYAIPSPLACSMQ